MPFSIAGPAYSALPSLDGINRAAERISSGLQVNFESNAAEAAISGRLDTAIGEQTISISNAINQTSAIQKADHTLGQASDILNRLQEFAVQVDNPALSQTDGDQIVETAQQDLDQIADLLEKDTFNGQPLFGEDNPAGIDIESLQQKLDELRSSNSPLEDEALADLQAEISLQRSELGAQQNAITSQVEALETSRIATSEARSRITDTDFAEAFTDLIKEELIFQANVKVFDQKRLAEESLIHLLTQ